MAVAQDMRKIQAMTRDDARTLYLRLARTENAIRKVDVDKSRKVIAAQEKAAADQATLKAEYDRLHAELTEYLKMHPERFQKPRKEQVKGVGSFGWGHDSSKVEVDKDQLEALKAYSDENGLALYTLTITADKAAIDAAFLDGHTVPGVDYTPAGDNPKISFAKEIDEARLGGE